MSIQVPNSPEDLVQMWTRCGCPRAGEDLVAVLIPFYLRERLVDVIVRCAAASGRPVDLHERLNGMVETALWSYLEGEACWE